VSAPDTKSDQDNAAPNHDGQTNGKSAKTDSNGILVVGVERLGRPEHEHAEKVGARNGRDDESKAEDSGIWAAVSRLARRQNVDLTLPEPAREDRVLVGCRALPPDERDDEKAPRDQSPQNVARRPGVL
jgi:hypothetical protein